MGRKAAGSPHRPCGTGRQAPSGLPATLTLRALHRDSPLGRPQLAKDMTIEPCLSGAATSMLAPLPSCRGGQATRQVLTAARMCFGQAPIGAAPSQHSCLQAATLKRGARLKHAMQNSASPARTQWCDLKGRSCAMALRSCTTPCTGSRPAASAAATAATSRGAWPTPSAAAPVSPAAACLAPALVRLCMALTQPCQAA